MEFLLCTLQAIDSCLQPFIAVLCFNFNGNRAEHWANYILLFVWDFQPLEKDIYKIAINSN